jgi:hypothetical protein
MEAGVTVVESQTHDVVTIVSGVGVAVQFSDRNDCRFAVRVVSSSLKTIGPGVAGMPSTRTCISNLASPTETRVGVALEAAFLVVSASTWDTSMNKSSSAVGFLMVVVRTVVHFRHGSVDMGDAGQGGFGVKTNPVVEVAAAVVAGCPPPFEFPGGVVGGCLL